jgi:hypothetical protein
MSAQFIETHTSSHPAYEQRDILAPSVRKLACPDSRLRVRRRTLAVVQCAELHPDALSRFSFRLSVNTSVTREIASS